MPISAIGAGVSAISGAIGLTQGSSSGGSSGGSQQQPMFNTTAGNVPNPNYTRPMGDSEFASKAQSGNTMPVKNSPAVKAQVTTANEVPAARDSKSTTTPEFGDVWANRLSKYLDYNTRQLG